MTDDDVVVLVPAGQPFLAAAAWVGTACWAELRVHQLISDLLGTATVAPLTPASAPSVGVPPAGVSPAGVSSAGVSSAGVSSAGVSSAGVPLARGMVGASSAGVPSVSGTVESANVDEVASGLDGTRSTGAPSASTLWVVRAHRTEVAEAWHRRLPELREFARPDFVGPGSDGEALVVAGDVVASLQALLEHYRKRRAQPMGPADGPVADTLAVAIARTEADLAMLTGEA